MEVRSLESSDREWADALVAQHFGSPRVVSRGRLHDTAALPALIAFQEDVPVGLLMYRVEGDECELVVLVSERPREGIAIALVHALVEHLRVSGCARAWLVTTNDNFGARSFYESLGWRLAAVHHGAVTRARELKPEIPVFGENGVAIEDELEYEFDVSRITRAST
ncbi:MAG: GNAT family N-acetyltransferase [Coriobacteriia bacterium]|nr:GNAT family N-acetyltransferase [Coriobacteriia bacterium]